MTPNRSADNGEAAASPAGWSGRNDLFVLLLFTALAIAHTWPLAQAPGTWSRNDVADTVLHEWTLAWVAHQLFASPLRLFEANIFFPEPHTLAYSDHLLVQALLAAPLLRAGASAVLAHNLVLIAGFALSGWATYLVVQRWTGSSIAGVLSGSLAAFNAFSLTRLPQLQDLHVQFFLPALFALDRLLATARWKYAWQLSGWYTLQSLTGNYLLVFTALSLVAAAVSRPRDWLGSRFAAVVPRLVVAAAVAIAVLLPFLIPYLLVSRDTGLQRSLDEAALYSAQFGDYLATGGRVHFQAWSQPFFKGDALFPGFIAICLTLLALGSPGVRRDARVRMTIGVAITAFAFSFGPAFPPYRWLYAVFPPMWGIRGAVRLGQIVLLAIAVLAGFGLARLQRQLTARMSTAVCLLLVVAVNLEAARAPFHYYQYRGIPPVYDTLERLGPNAVVVWLPFPIPAFNHQNGSFMLVSTRSWVRMLNGYSGFKPASYYEHAAALETFPDRRSIDYLRAQRVTHVLVDGRNMRKDALDRLATFEDLTLTTTDGNLRIYELMP